MTAMLETKALVKRFGGLKVLDGLDLKVEEGEVRCLIGPNGSGKSTLLKTILGLHECDGGDVLIAGKSVRGARPFEIVRRGVSVKFQIVSVFRDLSVYQNLRVPAQRVVRDEDERAARIERILELTDLGAFRDTPAGILSHGQQQWLEIGMAIVTEPRLLFLDEPTAGMTPEETQKTARIAERLNREAGITIVAVEHDMNFVRYINRRISVLHQGRIFFEGNLDEVRANPDIQKIYFGSRK